MNLEGLTQILVGFALIYLIIVVVIYVLNSLLLNSLHKYIYGKGTLLAWFPITSTYVLGKVTVNSGFGWFLILFPFISVFVPSEYSEIVSSLYSLVSSVLFIYAVVKFFILRNKMKRSSLEIEHFINNQPIYNSNQAFQQQKMQYQQMINNNQQNYQQSYQQNYQQVPNQQQVYQSPNNVQQPENTIPSFSNPTVNSVYQNNNNGQNNGNM